MENKYWLDSPVFEYIKANPGKEQIEVIRHFHIVGATMTAIHNLKKANLIYSKWTPLQLPQGTTRLYPL